MFIYYSAKESFVSKKILDRREFYKKISKEKQISRYFIYIYTFILYTELLTKAAIVIIIIIIIIYLLYRH
jgi:hypothetical protein